MSAIDCAHEYEVVDAVCSGRWPDACDPELREHAKVCPVCRDVVTIAPALRQEHRLTDVQVPAAGQVWWRAAIRARADAAREAARPMVWLQAIAGAGAFGAALAAVAGVWPRLEGTIRLVLPSNGASLQESLPLLLIIGLGLVAAPIAYYLTVPRD